MVDFDSAGRYGLCQLANSIGAKGLTVEDATILNMPNSGGVGRITCDDCYTVLNSGDCPEGAWAFVSYLLSDEKQVEVEKKHSLGLNWTNKKAFELSIQNMALTDDKPKTLKGSHTFDDNSVLDYEYQIKVNAEQAEEYRNFVMNATKLEYDNFDVSIILWEEYKRFENDEITAEECARTIQDRVEILLSEN